MDDSKDKNLLLDYYNTRWNVFQNHLVNTKNHLGVEDLHQLRVEIKKMRALIGLLVITFDESFIRKEFEKPLVKIFKPGGKLREIHINKYLAASYNFPFMQEYIVYLDSLATKYIEKLLTRLDQFSDEKMNLFKFKLPELVSSVKIEILINSAHEFLIGEFNNIRDLFSESISDKQIHKIRMHLKAAGYILKLLLDLKPEKSTLIFYQQIY